MKRDMDLIRQILLYIESNEEAGVSVEYESLPDDFSNVDGSTFRYHIGLLHDHEMITGIDHFSGMEVSGITWDGHEFLDNARFKGLESRRKISRDAFVDGIQKRIDVRRYESSLLALERLDRFVSLVTEHDLFRTDTIGQIGWLK